MKKFKYTLAIRPNSIKELIGKLQSLGYGNYHPQYTDNWLCTGFNGRYGELGTVRNIGSFKTVPGNNHYKEHERLIVEDEQTFLALAAMVDDDKFYKGEWVVCTGASPGNKYYTNGELYQIIKDEYLDSEMRWVKTTDNTVSANGWGVNNFRKATKEEIIKHFEKRNSLSTEDVVTYDGSNWSTSKVAANNKIGHRGIDPFHEEEINYAKQDINNVFKFAQNYGYRTTDKASDLVLFTNKKVKRAKLLVL